MTLIRWTPKLAVGVPEIDRQHRQLVDIVNRLYDHIVAGDGRDILGAIIEELERHAERHFAAEEQLMDSHGYANADSHKAEHRTLLDDIHRHCDDYVLGSGNPKVILGYVEHWLLRHMEEADRRLGTALAGADA